MVNDDNYDASFYENIKNISWRTMIDDDDNDVSF